MEGNRKIKIDGGAVQSYQDELYEIQIDKLNHRVTFFSILITGIVLATILFGYLYIKDNFTRMPKEVENLSQQVVERMSALSERYSELEQSINSKLSILEKLTEAIRKEQKDTQTLINKLNADKIDRKEIGDIIAKTTTDTTGAVKEMRKDIKTQNENITNQFNQLSANIATNKKDITTYAQSTAALQKDIEKLRADTKDFSMFLNDAVKNETLEKRFKMEREEYENMLNRYKAIIDQRFKVTDDKLEKIKTTPASSSADTRKTEVKRPSPDLKPKANKAPAYNPPEQLEDNLPNPKQGNILEQELNN